jgi:hypothetical protein
MGIVGGIEGLACSHAKSRVVDISIGRYFTTGRRCLPSGARGGGDGEGEGGEGSGGFGDVNVAVLWEDRTFMVSLS